MVGGYNFNKNGVQPRDRRRERQPGSAWKVFDLAAALEDGFTAATRRVYSGPWVYQQPGEPAFGHLLDPQRRGRLLLREDPAVGGARGLRQQRLRARRRSTPRHPAARRTSPSSRTTFGITTTISVNPSMVIGGLNIGVTPLDMAHAYETIANDGTADDRHAGLVHLRRRRHAATTPAEETRRRRQDAARDRSASSRSAQPATRQLAHATSRRDHGPRLQLRRRPDRDQSMMRDVLSRSARRPSAAIPGVAAWGKTGTTSNYADAWFIGSTPQGRQRAVDDGRGVGRLPQRRPLDGEGLRRQAGLRRHLPGADLAATTSRRRCTTTTAIPTQRSHAAQTPATTHRRERAPSRHDRGERGPAPTAPPPAPTGATPASRPARRRSPGGATTTATVDQRRRRTVDQRRRRRTTPRRPRARPPRRPRAPAPAAA